MAEVLVIGSGGRENALAQVMEVSDEVSRVVVAPEAGEGLKAFSSTEEKPFVIIGPEVPLVAGLADDMRDRGYVVLGASKKAAQYEASKARATELARQASILHPETFIARGKYMSQATREYIAGHKPQHYVIKADGLANGKGVVLPNSAEEASKTVEGMIDGSLFNGAGSKIINFQRRHSGSEVSAMLVVGEGKNDFVMLPLSQDHKRLKNDDQGPNTGGMGAYAPVPSSIVNTKQYQKIYEKAYASLSGMEAEGIKYTSAVLYMGLMMPEVSEEGFEDDSLLIEYNVRFGDPETQTILPLLQHAGVDVYRFLRSAAEGKIEKPNVDFANIGYAALSVCLAAKGYPDSPKKRDVIKGLDREYNDVSVQLAGVNKRQGQVLTNGGRVLYVTGVGRTIDEAAIKAYAAIGKDAIQFDGMQYREDIGWQARGVA